jgi:ABC-2 type transport system permease protein
LIKLHWTKYSNNYPPNPHKMKTVFKIAKTELRTLFYSPIAWLLIIVFLIQCGLAYFGKIEGLLRIQDVGGPRAGQVLHVLTLKVFAQQNGVFSAVMQKLYFYLPLLTMGLISRETSSGTMRLLYSSPIKVWQIVIGKYFSMLAYGAIMIAGVGIFMIISTFHIRMLDAGMLVSAALGFYMVIAAYAAIGLFMSSLTTYQVVAAVATFITIGLLSLMGTMWQDVAFVKDLTYFLSIEGRTNHFMHGLISSKDLIYFLVVIYMFLGLTILKLKTGMESKPMIVKIARYVAVIVSGLMIGYITASPKLALYYDATANKNNTLTVNSQHIIKELNDAPLEITAYNNLFGKFSFLGMPEYENQLATVWEPYTRFKPDITLNYVNYYDSSYDDASHMFEGDYKGKTLDQLAARVTKAQGKKLSMFLKPAQIRKLIDLKPEMNRYVIQLKYKGRTTWLRVYDDQIMFPMETEVAAAFKQLLNAQLPRIMFVTGQLERAPFKAGDREYEQVTSKKSFRYSLINQGFTVDTVDLRNADVPAGITALVLSDPRVALDSSAMRKLQAYIDAGGNILIEGEPGKQQMLNPLLSKLGVTLMDGMVVEPSQLGADVILTNVTPAAAAFTNILQQKEEDSLPVVMKEATALAYNTNSGFTVTPLLMSNSEKTWMRKTPIVKDSAEVTYQPEQGDQKGAVPLALGLERTINGRKQRIVVTGDADFMSNIELARYNVESANFYFNTALFSWLDNGEFPIDASRPKDKDNHIKISSEALSAWSVIFTWIVPGIVLLMAVVLLIRRKRQ